MKITYKNKDIERDCTDIRQATRKYGAENAEMLVYCLNLLAAAPSFSILLSVKPRNLHELKRNLAKRYAMNLDGGYRLIFSKRLDGKIELICIESIEDYHRG